jgi:hypothetical protein
MVSRARGRPEQWLSARHGLAEWALDQDNPLTTPAPPTSLRRPPSPRAPARRGGSGGDWAGWLAWGWRMLIFWGNKG